MKKIPVWPLWIIFLALILLAGKYPGLLNLVIPVWFWTALITTIIINKKNKKLLKI